MLKSRHRGRSAKRKRGSAQPQGIDRPFYSKPSLTRRILLEIKLQKRENL
jgi:hypothetical protein